MSEGKRTPRRRRLHSAIRYQPPVSFSIDRHGHVLNSQIIKSSGSAVLDAEALSLMTRAAPLPPPPAAVPDTDLTFVLPIRFEGSSKQ